MKALTVLELIGDTPHLRLQRIFDPGIEVWIKLERFNPGGSIKDRIALAMIEDAEREGKLVAGSTIIEPTSGNTGIGLAMVAAIKRYPLILVMPESMSLERRRLLAVYGARCELTPREKGMRGAIDRAIELAQSIPSSWIPQQFENPSNVDIHRRTTAKEILDDFPEGLDFLICGVGTGGHITGCAEILKKHFPALKVFAVEPAESPVLEGGQAGPHPLQGIGAGFVPKILNQSLLDGIIAVDKEEAYAFTVRIVREEGILAGISTGAALAAIARRRPLIPDGSRVLTFNYDTGERYLSVEGLF